MLVGKRAGCPDHVWQGAYSSRLVCRCSLGRTMTQGLSLHSVSPYHILVVNLGCDNVDQNMIANEAAEPEAARPTAHLWVKQEASW
jgi:hypothetical protein